jgi:hypothetical protein
VTATAEHAIAGCQRTPFPGISIRRAPVAGRAEQSR